MTKLERSKHYQIIKKNRFKSLFCTLVDMHALVLHSYLDFEYL